VTTIVSVLPVSDLMVGRAAAWFGRYGIIKAGVRLDTETVGLSARYMRWAEYTKRRLSDASLPNFHSSILVETNNPVLISASKIMITMDISKSVNACFGEDDGRKIFI